MELISLQVSIELILGSALLIPEVRFWVDCGLNGDLGTETELSLDLKPPGRWQGTFVTQPATTFFYRFGISAQAGAQWSLRIYDPAARADVLADEDCLTTRKCWLLGTCNLSPPASTGLVRTKVEDSQHGGAAESSKLRTGHPARHAKVVVLAQHRLRG